MSWTDTLPPINRQRIRAFGSMAEPDNLAVRKMLIRELLQRVRDVFTVIEYNGDEGVPTIWCKHPGGYVDNLRFGVTFEENRIRESEALYANLDGALHFAASDIETAIPESQQAIRLAMHQVRTLIQSSRNWQSRKNRVKSRGVISTIEQLITDAA